MGLFKSEEEKLHQEKEDIKFWEGKILEQGEYNGKVGHIHQGLSYAGVWGVRNNGKMKFKSSKFEIHDTKLLIERNKMIIEFSNIKEIFHEDDNEAIILLNNDSGIPIKSASNSRAVVLKFIAFINILDSLIENNKSNINVQSNTSDENSDDKIDKLLRLGEMYNQGLLSDEEFAIMKSELFNGNTNEEVPAENDEYEQIENNDNIIENVCDNCGMEVSSEDIFCSECGTQLK